jgi:nucleotide-binding universal stress UspA family protein
MSDRESKGTMMERFRDILVAVDLSEPHGFVSGTLAEPSRAAIERALWLARANSARLLFMYVLDPSTIRIQPDKQQFPAEYPHEATLTGEASDVLSKLVDDARKQGVAAEHRVTVGKSWVELIRQVLKGDHDLLIAGTRRFGMWRSMLLGSTGMKLLRQCPCPVWITQPQRDRIASILVAHDLGPVGDLAMELGCSMARTHDARLHVFHAIRFPEMEEMFPTSVSLDDIAQSRGNAERHIAGQLERFQMSGRAEVHLEYGEAYSDILNLIERHHIELLVMGTVARTGIGGFITGNTAERLLPHIGCSVIAVKPTGFKSPVTLEQDVG